MAADHRLRQESTLIPTDIAKYATSGNRECAETVDRYFDRLSRALAMVINIVDPHVVVLGGGVSRIDALYTEIPQRWEAHIFSEQVSTQLRRAHHGDAGGVRGAAWLWPRTT